MGYSYAVESYASAKGDLLALLPAHHAEVELAGIPLNVNDTSYAMYEAADSLHLVTCRLDSKLVGYYSCFVQANPHSAGMLTAYTDAFYLDPKHRRGRVGIELFKYVEVSLRRRGCSVMYAGEKLGSGVGSLLRYVGFTPTELVYVKLLE